MFTRKHIVLISGLLLAPPLSAHTLSQAIQLALSQNPEIMSARQGVGMAHEKVDQAEAGWMPTVDLTYDRGTEYKNKEGSDHTRLTREATSLTVNQPIFDGGATSAAVERSGQLHRASTIHLDEIRSSVTLKAIEAWYEVYRLQRVIKLTETNVKEHKKVVTQIRLKVEAGGAGKDELARAETPWILAKNALINARGDYQDALANYAAVVGVKPHTSLKDGLAVDEEMLPATIDDALVVLNRHSYILRTAEANLAVARADYEGAKSGLLPTVDLELQGGVKENDAGVRGTDQDYTAFLKFNYNLFNGGADESYRREMARAMLDSQEQLALARRNMEEQLHQLWNGLGVSRGLLQTSKQQLAIAQDNYETAKEQFKLGEGDIMAIMAADDALLQARKSLLRDKIDTQLGLYRALSHMGVLLGHLDVPDEAVTDEDLAPFEQDMLLVERVLDGVGDVLDEVNPLSTPDPDVSEASVTASVHTETTEAAEMENLAAVTANNNSASAGNGRLLAPAPEAPSTLNGKMKESGWLVLNVVDEVEDKLDQMALEREQRAAEERRREEERLAAEAEAKRKDDMARMRALAYAAKADKIRRMAEFPKRQAHRRKVALQGRLDQYSNRMALYNQNMRLSSRLLGQRQQELKAQMGAYNKRIARHNLQSVIQMKGKERKKVALSRSGVRQDAFGAKVKQGLYRQSEQKQYRKQANKARVIAQLNGTAKPPAAPKPDPLGDLIRLFSPDSAPRD